MLYVGSDATLYFDQPEVMVPAKHLVNGSYDPALPNAPR